MHQLTTIALYAYVLVTALVTIWAAGYASAIAKVYLTKSIVRSLLADKTAPPEDTLAAIHKGPSRASVVFVTVVAALIGAVIWPGILAFLVFTHGQLISNRIQQKAAMERLTKSLGSLGGLGGRNPFADPYSNPFAADSLSPSLNRPSRRYVDENDRW